MITTVAAVAGIWTAAAFPAAVLIGRRLRHTRHLEDQTMTTTPPTFGRPFVLQRDLDPTGVSGVGTVADGIEFPDDTVVIRWRGEHASTVVWASLADALHVHGHGGATRVVWATAESNTAHAQRAADAEQRFTDLRAEVQRQQRAGTPTAPTIAQGVAAHVLWQEGLGGYPAGSFTTALLKAWWQADPANSARLAHAWPQYGAAIALLTQVGGPEKLRVIAGDQQTAVPDRP